MTFELPFVRRKRLKDLPRSLQELEPDPLADVVYTGSLEVDALAELSALESAFKGRRKREDDRFRDATDSEYWVAVCFKTRAHKEAFLAGLPGISPIDGDKYVNGHQLAHRLGINIEGE